MVPPDQLMAEAKAIATAIARNHRLMVQHVKAVINDGLNLTLEDGRRIETVSCFLSVDLDASC